MSKEPVLRHDSQIDTQNRLDSLHNSSEPRKQYPHEQAALRETVLHSCVGQQSAPYLHLLCEPNPIEEIQQRVGDQATIPRKLSNALRHHYAGEDQNNTFIYPRSEEEEILEVTDFYVGRNKVMTSVSMYTSQVDSSSMAFATQFADMGSLDTLSSDSRDLELVERYDSYRTIPHQLGRTYSSSEESHGGMDIETLPTFSNDRVSITTYTSTEETMETSSISTSYTSYEELDTDYKYSVEVLPDIEYDDDGTLSVSSADVELTWRDEEIQPIPHIVQRTYSSSASEESCEDGQGETANERIEEGFIDYRQTSSSLDGPIPYSYQSRCFSQPGYIQSDSWTEETIESRRITAVETLESLPIAYPQPPMHANESDNRAKGKKLHILKKAARLLSHFFRGKTRTSRYPESRYENQTKKRSLASIFWSRSS